MSRLTGDSSHYRTRPNISDTLPHVAFKTVLIISSVSFVKQSLVTVLGTAKAMNNSHLGLLLFPCTKWSEAILPKHSSVFLPVIMPIRVVELWIRDMLMMNLSATVEEDGCMLCIFSILTVITSGWRLQCEPSKKVNLDPKRRIMLISKDISTPGQHSLIQRYWSKDVRSWKRPILHLGGGVSQNSLQQGAGDLFGWKSSTFCFLIQLLVCQVGWVCRLKYFSSNAKFTSAVWRCSGCWFGAKTKAGGLSHIKPWETQQHAICFHLGGFLQSDTRLTAAKHTLPADGLYFAFVLNK